MKNNAETQAGRENQDLRINHGYAACPFMQIQTHLTVADNRQT